MKSAHQVFQAASIVLVCSGLLSELVVLHKLPEAGWCMPTTVVYHMSSISPSHYQGCGKFDLSWRLIWLQFSSIYRWRIFMVWQYSASQATVKVTFPIWMLVVCSKTWLVCGWLQRRAFYFFLTWRGRSVLVMEVILTVWAGMIWKEKASLYCTIHL